MRTDNKTLYGIKEDTERAALVIWSFITLISSLLGDSIILVSTTRYRAIKQHKVIVTVIQHLAICDLMQTVFRVIPVTMAMKKDVWVAGEFLCHVQDNVGWIGAVTTLLLTCTMTTFKLITVKHPLKAGTLSSKFGHRVCCLVWLLVLVLYIPVFYVKMRYLRDTIHFSYSDYECNYSYRSSTRDIPIWYETYFLVLFPVIGVISYTTLIVTSLLLLIVARRVAREQNQTLRKEGVITVLLTVLVLFISYLPYSITFVAWLQGIQYSETAWRAVCYVQYLNIMANFFVYCFTVRSFRQFLWKKIVSAVLFPKRSIRRLRGKVPPAVVKNTSSEASKLQKNGTACTLDSTVF